MRQVSILSPEVFTVSGLLTHAECDEYIAFSEALGYGEAPVTTFLGPVMDKSVRDNERVMLGGGAIHLHHDSHSFPRP
jgi:hypothetical protein